MGRVGTQIYTIYMCEYRILRGYEEAGTVADYKVELPDGTGFAFSGQVSTKIDSAAVNAALTFTATISLNSDTPLYVVIEGDAVTESSCQKGTQPVSGGRAVQVSGIRLISNTNSEAVMARLKGYYAKALKVKLRTPWVPGMDCGTRISVPTRFGPVVGNIRRMDIDLTGGLLANVEVVA